MENNDFNNMKNNDSNNIQRDLDGKIAIVTGAASGIGLAITKLLEARGAIVVAEDINPAVNDVFKDNKRIVPFVGDVATEQAAQEVVATTTERFGKLDILVNNAARIVYKNAIDMTLEEWNSILGITATGVFLHSREALKAMIPKNGRDRQHRIVCLLSNLPRYLSLCCGEGRTRTNHSHDRAGSHRTRHSSQRSRRGRCRDQPPQYLS
jgi:NAD(P)-dependent dehydrogenase (short-subunit alcohol dehydrogenase family)